MDPLSHTELEVIESYGKGHRDQEVADDLDKPVWTVKTHKKNIFKKIGVNTTHEMVLYLISLKTGKPFDIQSIRRFGVSAILSLAMAISISLDYRPTPTRSRRNTRLARIQTTRVRREVENTYVV